MSLSPSLLRPAGRSRCLNSTVRFCRPGTWSPGLARKSGSRLSSDFSGQHLVDVFREVARVLRDDGTLWLKLGRFLLWELGQLREAGEHLGEGFGQTPHGSLLAFRPPMAAAQKSSPTSLNSSRFTTLQSRIRRRSNFGGIPARNSTKRRSRRMFRARNRARCALALRNPNPLFWQAATTVSTRRVLYSSTSTQRSGAKGGSGLRAAICHSATGRLVPVRRWAQSDNPFPCSWCLHESRTALSFQNFECKVCAPVHLEGQMNPKHRQRLKVPSRQQRPHINSLETQFFGQLSNRRLGISVIATNKHRGILRAKLRIGHITRAGRVEGFDDACTFGQVGDLFSGGCGVAHGKT